MKFCARNLSNNICCNLLHVQPFFLPYVTGLIGMFTKMVGQQPVGILTGVVGIQGLFDV